MNKAHHVLGLILWLTVLQAVTGHAQGRPDLEEQQKNYSIPFSLAISGGISLGSYESGLNWALVKYLKTRRNETTDIMVDRVYPDLMSLSGASAGSINALISAITWCIDDARLKNQPSDLDYRDDIHRNLFRKLWLNVGIDELLPADTDSYRQGDALLTRAAFDRAITQIIDMLNANIFRQDCSIPLGMTVTRVDPVKMSLAGVKVANQRFMIPVRLQAMADDPKSGRIEIVSQMLNQDDPLLGNVMYLRQTKPAGDNRYVIDPQHLINAILTSSAYPLAFGRMKLPYCANQPANDQSARSYECPPGYQARIDEFIDGGVFDNIPLGMAKLLAEPREHDQLTRARWLDSGRPYSYIYLDPKTRRPVMQQTDSEDALQAQPETDKKTELDFLNSGIRTHFKFLSGAVSTGRNYELYNELRVGGWTSHSYDFTCQLLTYLGINKGDTNQCASNLDPGESECQHLRDQLDADQVLNRGQSQKAAACLGRDQQVLEKRYYEYQGEAMAPREISDQRQRLLSRLQRLAQQNDLPQLALSIATAMDDKLGDRRILITRRFAPITGEMLGAFGAFVDRSFREYDYFAGVYDAVYGVADFLCQRHDHYSTCLAEKTRETYVLLGIPQQPDANTAFYLMASLEHAGFRQPGSPWAWLMSAEYFGSRQLAGNVPIIFQALTRSIEVTEDGIYEEPEFLAFVQNLFALGYDTSHSSQFMQRIHRLRHKSPRNWLYPLTSRISTRLLAIEQDAEDANDVYAPLVRGALGFGAFALHSFIKDDESKLLTRSAAPADTWLNWLPYELGADYRNGGFIVSWLPGVDIDDQYSVDFKITPAQLNRYAEDTIWFSQLDVFFSYRREGVISSIGVGPTLTRTFKDWDRARRTNFGASLYVGLLEDRLRFSLGQRSRDSEDFAGETVYFSIAVTDIPGFVYWLTKGR